MSRGRKVKIKDTELIDTCWNVNEDTELQLMEQIQN